MAERTWSVRALVEYVYRSGSLGSEFGADSLQEGSRIHRLVQSRYGEEDRREVALRAEINSGEECYVLEGRCDGLLQPGPDRERVTVDEIKSTSADLALLPGDGIPVHWAQAYCYAWMITRAEALERIDVQLTYVQTGSGEERRFLRTPSREELERFVDGLVLVYAPYVRLQDNHLKERDESLRRLAFPFAGYRKGQRELAAAVYAAQRDGRRLFARAPTGTGKTVSTLFPTLKAMGESRLRRLVYLTARTTTQEAAEAAIRLLEERGDLRLRSVTLTAKEKICFRETVDCRPESCPYADGFYDRLNAGLFDLLSAERRIGRETVEAYARKHRLCPFELSLEAAYAADAVIGDYHYIFDPRVSLKRLWEEERRRTALLVDEAHNLADRGREMFSAELSKRACLAVSRGMKRARPELAAAAGQANRVFIRLRKEASGGGKGFPVYAAAPSELADILRELIPAAEAELALRADRRRGAERADGLADGQADGQAMDQAELGERLLDLYFQAKHFLRILEEYDDRYVTRLREEDGELVLRLDCLDPSLSLRRVTGGFRSTVCFSATLVPLGFYRELLGGEEEDYRISLASPFSREQLDVFLLPCSTRYRDRARTLGEVARRLDELLRARPGRYLFFFPSYEYLNGVLEPVRALNPPARLLVQSGGMTDGDRANFLREFQQDTGEPLAGFAVMGGAFGEAVDLAGDRLTGVAVVGVGLPQLGPDRDLLRDYYERTGRNGFDYAYVYPGMTKVLQAAGRLIRTETDRGTLLLVDDRFARLPYRRLLPEEWQPIRTLTEREPLPPWEGPAPDARQALPPE